MENDNINQPLILGSEGNQPPPIITSEELLNTAKTELNRDVTKRDSEEIAFLTKNFKNKKEEYAKGDKNTKAKLEAEVVQTGERIFNADSFRQELSDEINNTEKNGHDPASKFPDYAKDFQAIMDGRLEVVYDDNNTPGYELNVGGFMPMQSIIEMIKGNAVDQKSKAGLKMLLQNQKALSDKANKTKEASFNYQKEYDNVMRTIVEAGDMRSLASDKIFSDRVFKDDLFNSIQRGTYKDLGLTENTVKGMDPTPNTPITPEDALTITSAIMKDEDMLKPYLAEYFTNALEQKYLINLDENVRNDLMAKKVASSSSSAAKQIISNEIQVGGGVVKNGIYIPKKK